MVQVHPGVLQRTLDDRLCLLISLYDVLILHHVLLHIDHILLTFRKDSLLRADKFSCTAVYWIFNKIFKHRCAKANNIVCQVSALTQAKTAGPRLERRPRRRRLEEGKKIPVSVFATCWMMTIACIYLIYLWRALFPTITGIPKSLALTSKSYFGFQRYCLRSKDEHVQEESRHLLKRTHPPRAPRSRPNLQPGVFVDTSLLTEEG